MRVSVNVFSKNTTLCPWKGLKAGLLNSEMSALTISTPHLPQMPLLNVKKKQFKKKKQSKMFQIM